MNCNKNKLIGARKYIFIIISLLFFTIHFGSLTAQTIISGKALSFKGQTITLYQYSDYITHTKEKLASTIIDTNGMFELRSNINNTYLGILKIEEIKAHIHVVPNTIYQIRFPSKDSIHLKTMTAQITFQKQDKEKLNDLIADFNLQHDNFLSENYMKFLRHSARTLVDTFRIKMNKRYERVISENDYFAKYVKYSIAIFEQSNRCSKKTLFEKYLDSIPVAYQHPLYMDFLNQFYSKYFLQFSLSKKGGDIVPAINVHKSYSKLMKLLSDDEFLKDEQIRELILIKGLYEVYNNSEFNDENILSILSTINKESKINEHRMLANNVIKKLTKLAVGTKAPSFQLINQNKVLVNLDDFKGKYVYLDFWATWCIPCLQEIKLMPELIEKYGNHVEFVSISIDKDFATMKKFLNKPEYSPEKIGNHWTFLHYGTYPDIKKDYEIRAIPAYFLIAPDGSLVKSPAKRPTENIEQTFINIMKANQPKTKHVWDK